MKIEAKENISTVSLNVVFEPDFMIFYLYLLLSFIPHLAINGNKNCILLRFPNKISGCENKRNKKRIVKILKKIQFRSNKKDPRRREKFKTFKRKIKKKSIVDHRREKSLSHHRASYMGMEDRVTL